MVDTSKFIESILAVSDRERQRYHVTLGQLREAAGNHVRAVSAVAPVRFIDGETGERLFVRDLISYRGYYSDLAFEPIGEPGAITTAGALYQACDEALGKTYEGYKGGEYLMESSTPLWISPYGLSDGRAILMVVRQDRELHILAKTITED